MSADDEKAAPDIPPLPVELEVPMAPMSGEAAEEELPPLPDEMEENAPLVGGKASGEELPPLPDEMEENAPPVGGKVSGMELPPLPPGMSDDAGAGSSTPVLRPQSAVGSAEPQSTSHPQAQKPKGKGAIMALSLALIACALYQGVQAWQAKQLEVEAKEKAQQNATAEAKATQQAKDAQAHADRIVGLAKPKHEAESALENLQNRRREFVQESGNVDTQRSRRRAEAEKALQEAKERKAELEKQLKEGRP